MVTPTVGQTSVTLNWGTGTTPNGFVVTIFDDAGGTNVINTYSSSSSVAHSYNYSGLDPLTQYWYKVSPKEAGGTVTAVCDLGTFTTTA